MSKKADRVAVPFERPLKNEPRTDSPPNGPEQTHFRIRILAQMHSKLADLIFADKKRVYRTRIGVIRNTTDLINGAIRQNYRKQFLHVSLMRMADPQYSSPPLETQATTCWTEDGHPRRLVVAWVSHPKRCVIHLEVAILWSAFQLVNLRSHKRLHSSKENHQPLIHSMPLPFWRITQSKEAIRLRSPPHHPATLRDDLVDHVAVDIGQAVVAALELVRELRVVEAELVQDRRLQIVNVDLVFGGAEGEFVRLAVRVAALDAAACEEDRVAIGEVIAAEDAAASRAAIADGPPSHRAADLAALLTLHFQQFENVSRRAA